MTSDAASLQPTAVVLEFSGDNFTPCIAADPLGSPQYDAKYQADVQTAIHIFRPYGTKVSPLALCDVYSSGAFRFAEAMLGPALDS